MSARTDANGQEKNAPISVLLITNRDSDNVGDQVIEACDLSLVETVLANLGFQCPWGQRGGDLGSRLKGKLADSKRLARIRSRSLAMVTDQYCSTFDSSLLEDARLSIKEADVVLFGGAPVFNYAYQNFYLKTATILKIARELGKPVLFSAVGIDSYSDTDARCQLLKEGLHNGSVVQITTRDGIDKLGEYISEGDGIPIELVPDPAVFAKYAFSKTALERRTPATVGLFVFRAGGFSANGIRFSRGQQVKFWKTLVERFEREGIEYELLTSGHFADEALLEYMVSNGHVKKSKCVFNISSPEALVKRISSYSAIVSCRLHPSIISFSFEVPSVSLIWNSKVTDFYRHIGYPERAIPVDKVLVDGRVSVDYVYDRVMEAMKSPVRKDKVFLESLYTSLYRGMERCVGNPGGATDPYSYDELERRIVPFAGTSEFELEEKIQRKLRRAYRGYNASVIKVEQLKDEIKKLRKASRKGIGSLLFHSGVPQASLSSGGGEDLSGKVSHLSSGNTEIRFATDLPNNGENVFIPCPFSCAGKKFVGWRLRVRIGSSWYWCLDGLGSLVVNKEGSKARAFLFMPGSKIPEFVAPFVVSAVAEAAWEDCSSLRRVFRLPGMASK